MKPTTRKQREFRRRLLHVAVASCFTGSVLAAPVNPTVVRGGATFNNAGSTLTVTNTPGTIVNWQSFGINSGETVRFVQQSSASTILNRVTGGDMTRILGTLQSNGKVFLVNPNGIFMGQGAVIDVAGLLATSLNITDDDFANGKLKFNADRLNPGSVTNAGQITTPNGGFVYLVAPQVENSGIINTPSGEAILAAGHSVELVDSTDPALRVQVKATSDEINLSQLMTSSNGNVFSVLNSGRISANTAVVGQNGKVQFRSAGSVQTTSTSIVEAKGDINMDGGLIRGFADTNGIYAGVLDVSGKNGGFVETSGHWIDVNQSQINARALSGSGKGGTWLLDPYDIEIVSTADSNVSITGGNMAPTSALSKIQNTTIQNQLNAGTNVVIDTFNNSGSEAGNIRVSANITTDGGSNAALASLTLNADGGVRVDNPISIDGVLFINSDINSVHATGSIITAAPTGSGVTVVNFSGAGSSFGFLRVGQEVTSPDVGAVQAGTTIISIDAINETVTLSQVTTGTTYNFYTAGTETTGGQGIDIRNTISANGVYMTAHSGGIDIKADVVSITNAYNSTLKGNVNLAAYNGDDVKITASSSSVGVSATGYTNIDSTGDIILQAGSSNGANATLTAATGQSISAEGMLRVYGGTASTGAYAEIKNTNSGQQQITAQGIEVIAAYGATTGFTGVGNYADIGNTAFSNQEISAGSGGIKVSGGDFGSANRAAVYSYGRQIVITDGDITVRGGNSTGNSNYAFLNGSGSNQEIYFTAPGRTLEVKGGGAGTNNSAGILASGDQYIGGVYCPDGCLQSYQPIIKITGGIGVNNRASISAGSTDSTYYQAIHAMSLQIKGGTGTGNQAYIIKQGFGGSQGIYVGLGDPNLSNSIFDEIGVVVTGGITIDGGNGGNLNFAGIRSENDQEIWSAGNITITAGGNGAGQMFNDAAIETGWGRGSYQAGGDQLIKFVGAGLQLRVEGGAAGQDNVARVASRGFSQTIKGWNANGASSSSFFLAGGADNNAFNPGIVVRGGVGGASNDAGIVISTNLTGCTSSCGAPGQYIYGGAINMTGGAGGGAYIAAERYSSNFGIAIAQNIYVQTGSSANYGALTMTAMAGGEVGIGSDKNNTNVSINTGSITMNGAANNAMVGALGYQGGGGSGTGNDAQVNIYLHEGGDMTMNGATARVGSEFGDSTVYMYANGMGPTIDSNFNLNGGSIGTAKASTGALGVNNTVWIYAGMYGGGVTQGVNSLIRTGNLYVHAYGGGISLLGDNVATDALNAADHGYASGMNGGPYGNVVVNMLTDAASVAGIPGVLPQTLSLAAFGGKNAQLGIIGNLDTTGLSSTWYLGSIVAGDTANASLFATGNLDYYGGVALYGSNSISLGSGAILTFGNSLPNNATAQLNMDAATVIQAATISASGGAVNLSADTLTLGSISNASSVAIGAGVLNMSSAQSISATGAITIQSDAADASILGSLTSTAGGTVTVNALNTHSLTVGTITSTGGAVNLSGAGITANGAISGLGVSANATSGNLLLSSVNGGAGAVALDGNDITLNGNVSGASVTVNANGALQVGTQITGTDKVELGAHTIALNGATVTSAAGPVSILSDTSIVQTGGGVTSTTLVKYLGSSVQLGGTVAAPTVNLVSTGDLTVTGSVFAEPLSVAADGGSFRAIAGVMTVDGGFISKTGNGLLDINILNDLTVTNNGRIFGTPDVDMITVGGQINLLSGGKVEAQSPNSIYLNFPILSSGGYVVDGVAGAITGPTGAGFYAGGNPAVLGTSLHVTYGAANNDAISFLVNEFNSSTESMFEEAFSSETFFQEGTGTAQAGTGEDEEEKKDEPKECG